MKLNLKWLALGSLLMGPIGCGAADDLSEALEEASAHYDSFDLTCAFDDFSGASEAEEEVSASLTQDDATYDCSDVSEQYTMMVAEFDSDGDGVLSDDELAEAEAEFISARETAVDANGDGELSADERDQWRDSELPGRKSKRGEHFEKSCDKLGKTEADCRGMRGDRKAKYKKDIKDRFDEFDTNNDGELSAEERDVMRLELYKERDDRRKDFVEKHDKDGDGKFGPEEREERRGDRKEEKRSR